MTRVGGFAAYEWVYVFDADEFLLHRYRGTGLRTVLGDVPDKHRPHQVRGPYWIAPLTTSTRTDLGRYGTEILPSISTSRLHADPRAARRRYGRTRECRTSTCPSRSKGIVRGRCGRTGSQGRGSLRSEQHAHERQFTLPPTRLRAGHVPLVEPSPGWPGSVLYGQRLKRLRLPAPHGWQSRMIRRLEVWLGGSTSSR